MAEGRGERATGTPNTIYDLSSVLFHSLEGGASYDQYIRDAEAAGDEELVDFFTRVRDEDSMRADEAQRLLAERTPTAAPTEGVARRPTEGVTAEPPPVAEPTTGSPRTEEPPPRTEEDRGLLDRAREALTGEEEPRRREEAGPRREIPRGSRGDEPLR